MRVTMATSPGTPGKANEDFVGAVPGAVVLLDGAGTPGAESICRHGVAWYTHRLGGVLLGLLSRGTDDDLPALLGASIEHVTSEHRHTCDVTDSTSPSATVAILRLNPDHAEYLLLADSYLVLDRHGAEPLVVTDDRELAVRRRLGVAMAAATEGTAEHERATEAFVTAYRAHRNRPGGFWVAKDDAGAAAEAVTGSRPIDDLAGAALLSNGASRIVDAYAMADWPEVLRVLGADGPAEVLRRVRVHEAAGDAVADDATIAHCTH